MNRQARRNTIQWQDNGKEVADMWKRTAYLGVFLSCALILSYIESLIPFYFGVPGMKLGLANLLVVLLLYLAGTKEAFAIAVLRIVLSGFLFGNLFGILYSLAGGLLSFAVMWLVKKTNKFSLISVSVCGGMSHNIGQLIVAALIADNYNVMYYMPVLLVAGIVTGFVIGIIAAELEHRLQFLFRKE